MRTGTVMVPITGYIEIDVELPSGASDKDAFEEAWRIYHEDKWKRDRVTWEATDRTADGNVSHAMLTEIDVAWDAEDAS